MSRRRAAGFALAGVLAAGPGVAQPPATDELCARTACWPGGPVKVPAGDGSFLELALPKAPYYHDGQALVVSGQTLLLEATVRGDALELERVTAIRDPKRTIVVTLEPADGPGVKGGTRLKVVNPLDRPLAYSARVHRATRGAALRPTSTCPVVGGGTGYEHWPYPIFRASLGKFALVAPDDRVCRVR